MKENNINNFFEDEIQEKINYRDFVYKYLSRWKLFLVLILSAFFLATIYLRYTTPLYESVATVMIKNNQKGGSGMSETSAFEDLSIFSEGNSIENEKAILVSRSLMKNVVEKLKLNHEYYQIGNVTGFKKREIYKQNPFEIKFDIDDSLNLNDYAFDLSIEVLNQNEITFEFINTHIKTKIPFNKWQTIRNGIRIKFQKNELFSKLTIGRTFEYKFISSENATNKYLGKLSVEQKEKTSTILNLRLTDNSISKSQDILNELINQYNEDAIKDKNLISKNTSDFISERVHVISKELGDIEDSAKIFKTKNDLTNVQFETESGLYSAKEVRNKFIDANTQLQLSYMMLEHLQMNNKPDDLIPINLGLSDSRIENIIYEHNKLVMERIEELKTTTLKNPKIINLSNRINEYKLNIESSIKNLILAKKRIFQEIELEEKRINTYLSRMPGFEKDLRSIVRQQEIKEALYIYLLQKREEAQIALAVGIGNAKIVDVAYSNGGIVSPKRNFIYLGALFSALILGFIIIYLIETLYDKVNSKQDIQKYNLPFIGNIPLGQPGQQIVISKGSKTAISEAFRTLRTNVDFMLSNKKDGARFIFVTSSVAKEGKSFTAINLSLSIALSEKKVLIVGLDLRAPKLEQYIGKERSKGITNFIIDKNLNLNDLIFTTELNRNVDILPSGDIPPNPSELMMHERMDLIFSEIKEKYDYIIVDTAPAGIVTDTFLLTKHVDVFLYIVRAHELPKKMLNIPSEIYKEKRLPNMTVLLNGTLASKGYGYGYGKGYGYGYGYGYTEGYYIEETKKTTLIQYLNPRNWFKQ